MRLRREYLATFTSSLQPWTQTKSVHPQDTSGVQHVVWGISFLFLISPASPNLPVVCFPLQGENWQLQGGAAWSIPWTWRPSQARKNQGLPFPVLDHQTVSSSSSILFPSLPLLSCLLSHVVPIVLCLANILILYCASWCHVV